MGRPPSNGGPSFRFNPSEVAEMEGILQAHNCLVPQREILVSLAEKFSNSAERSGRPPVQMKQVWNWFQNRRYALRAKSAKPPVKLNVSPMPQHDSPAARNVSQAPQHPPLPAATVRNVPQVPQPVPTPTVQSVGRNGTDNSPMEFEAKSARDGAWYDVASFLSHRSLETNDPEVLVRFAGFGPEEDEWVNVRKHVRQRSLPCESSECVAVLPGDLILCFQEGKEQALYFDAHVLDAQRRRHDVRGCRCRFLVRYDHDQSEEIVPLRKVCRRPETDYRMQQLHADSANMKQNKNGPEPHKANNVKAYPAAEITSKQPKFDGPTETIPKPGNAEVAADSGSVPVTVSDANISITTAVAPTAHSSEPLASAITPSPHSNVSVAPTLAPDPNARVPGANILASVASLAPVNPTAAHIANASDPGATAVAPVASSVPVAPAVPPVANSNVPGATVMAPTASNVHATPAGDPVADSSVPIVPSIPAANSSVPIAPAAALAASSCAPGATVVDPIASNIHVAPSTAPVANSCAPIVPTAPAADASVAVSEAPTPAANSSATTVSNMAPTANYSVPIALTTALHTNSSVSMDPTANSSVHVAPTVVPAANASTPTASSAEAPVANSSAPTASSAEVPVANSSIPVAMTTEAPFATNSSAPVAMTAEAPFANTPVAMTTEAPFLVAEFNVLVEKASESCSTDNVDNTNAESANLAIPSGIDTSGVSEEGPSDSMQLR